MSTNVAATRNHEYILIKGRSRIFCRRAFLPIRGREQFRVIRQHTVEGARKGGERFAAAYPHARELVGGLNILDGRIEGERVERRPDIAIAEQVLQHDLLLRERIVMERLAGGVAEELDWLSKVRLQRRLRLHQFGLGRGIVGRLPDIDVMHSMGGDLHTLVLEHMYL